MKYLTIEELKHLSRAELRRLFAEITAGLATLPSGSIAQAMALANLANIRAVLAMSRRRRPETPAP